MRHKVGEYCIVEGLTFNDVMSPDMPLKDQLAIMQSLGRHQVDMMLQNDPASHLCEICCIPKAFPSPRLINEHGNPAFVHLCADCWSLSSQGLSPGEIRKRRSEFVTLKG